MERCHKCQEEIKTNEGRYYTTTNKGEQTIICEECIECHDKERRVPKYE